jgi:hypothetical protein
MKPRTRKKRNPIAKKLADPRYRQRVVPAKRQRNETNLKAAQDYRRAIQEMTDDAKAIAGRRGYADVGWLHESQ